MECNKCNKTLNTNIIYKDPDDNSKKICNVCYRKLKAIQNRPKDYKSRREQIADRICSECGSKTTRLAYSYGFPYFRWISDKKGGWYCAKCYDRLTNTKEKQKQKNSNRLKYKGKYIRIKNFKRTGRCSWCPNNIFDGSCKQTQLHHNENKYNDENPLDNGTELCASCHRKETIRLAKLQ